MSWLRHFLIRETQYYYYYSSLFHFSISFYYLRSDQQHLFIDNFFNFQSGGDDDPMSDNDMSRDGDSNDGDAMSRVPATDIDQETMETLRQQVCLFTLIYSTFSGYALASQPASLPNIYFFSLRQSTNKLFYLYIKMFIKINKILPSNRVIPST